MWLHRGPASITALRTELARARQGESSTLPQSLLIEALLHQQSPDTVPDVAAFITASGDEQARGRALTALVTLMPEAGLALSERLHSSGSPTLDVHATGLRAVYGVEEAYGALLDRCRLEGSSSALRWVGRIARPESVAVLSRGLRDPDPATRLDVVTSLACFGERGAWESLLVGIEDRDVSVSTQAANLVVAWLGDVPKAVAFTHGWTFESSGRLDAKSRRDLTASRPAFSTRSHAAFGTPGGSR